MSTSPDKTREAITEFTKMAMLGGLLIVCYVMSPWLLDGGTLPDWQNGAEHTSFRILDRIPWLPISAVFSFVPALVLASRKIPRRVRLAVTDEQLDSPDGTYVVGKAVVLQREGEYTTYRDSR